MNIQVAAAYMKHGYRARRPSWDPEIYFFMGALGLVRHTYFNSASYDKETKTFIYRKVPVDDDTFFFELEDLLAEDYQLITDNIRKDFNKYDQLEYNDGTDWDNWVAPKGGWCDDEDEDEEDK